MSRKVLIVDDDPGILFTVDAILGESGFEVLTANSGQECLEVLQSGYRGLILMDVMMPGLDGWDTIQQITDNQLLEGNIICMLTAVAAPGPKMESLKECVLDYVTKPFDAETLLAVVEECLAYA